MVQGLSKFPVSLCLSLSMLYYYFGFSFLASLIPFFVSLLINRVLARKRKSLHVKMEKCADEKSNKINEMLTNAKTIKLYGWQGTFI